MTATFELTEWLVQRSWTVSDLGIVDGPGVPRQGTLRLRASRWDERLTTRWLDASLWWERSDEPVAATYHALIASRDTPSPQQDRMTLLLMEAAIRDALRAGAAMLVPHGSPIAPWLEHFVDLFHAPRLVIECAPSRLDLEQWLAKLEQLPSEVDIAVSPPLESSVDLTNVSDCPARDRLAVGLADRLTVLHLRSGGVIDRLVRQRLANGQHDVGSVRVGLREVPGESEVFELLDQGAVGWYLMESEEVGSPLAPMYCVEDAPVPKLDEFLLARGATEAGSWDYLCHCTRAPEGPWPHESVRAWRDRVVLGEQSSLATALDALQRILKQQIVWGGHRVTRGETDVVCFSALPLCEFLARRTFRSHLKRWDYEPYGIAIKRQCVVELGGRSVVYGDSQCWKSLSADLRPYFQDRGKRYDWAEEQEWRVVGNVALQGIGAEDLFVFVPDEAAGRELRRAVQIPWPIVRIS